MSLLLYQQWLKNQNPPFFTQDRGCRDLHFIFHLSFSSFQTIDKFSSDVSLKVAYKFQLQSNVLPLVFMTKSFLHLLYMWSDLKRFFFCVCGLLIPPQTPMDFFCKSPNHPSPHCSPLDGEHQLPATAMTCSSLHSNLIIVHSPGIQPLLDGKDFNINIIQVHAMVWKDDSSWLGLPKLI